MGLRFDLPVWQGLYEELKDRRFVVLAVALDSGGAANVPEQRVTRDGLWRERYNLIADSASGRGRLAVGSRP